MRLRAASGDDGDLLEKQRQEQKVKPEQPRSQPLLKPLHGRQPQTLAGMRALKRMQQAPPPEIVEGKRKRSASTWLSEFVKVRSKPAVDVAC